MSKRSNSTGRSAGSSHHIRLYRSSVLDTAAWRHLSPAATKVLIDMWSRCNGTNNGQISYSARDGVEINMHRNTVAKALRELEDVGFIVCEEAWTFNQGGRKSRKWRLTTEPANGKPATREFARWQPDRHAETSPDEDVSEPDEEISASSLRDRCVLNQGRKTETGNNISRCVPEEGRFWPFSPEKRPSGGTVYSLPCRGASDVEADSPQRTLPNHARSIAFPVVDSSTWIDLNRDRLELDPARPTPSTTIH